VSQINQKSGDMYIHPPDKIRVDDSESFSFCWLHKTERCTGSCQAFDPNHSDDDTGKFTSCRLINIAISVGGLFSLFVKNFTSQQRFPGQDVPPPKVNL